MKRIVSGGQTGADRAAFDFAIEAGYAYGGFVPLGRSDELGPIPARYSGLVEAPSAEPAVRTALNVASSDGTVVMSHGRLTGGSSITAQLVQLLDRPLILLDLQTVDPVEAAMQLERWIERHAISVLNVAGPRQSEDARIYGDTLAVLRLTLPPAPRGT